MVTTVSPSYGSITTHTITLNSLATDATLLTGRQGTVIDNSVELALDCHLGGKFTAGTTPTTGKQIEVWLFSTWDNGTTYSAGMGASDAGITLTNEKPQMVRAAVIQTDATTGHVYEWGGVSVAAAFGGYVPKKWGVFVTHNMGVSLSASGNEVKHQPITVTSA